MFYSYIQKKCPHCDKIGKNIKKDGANKIFLISSLKDELLERKKSKDAITFKGDSTYLSDFTE